MAWVKYIASMSTSDASALLCLHLSVSWCLDFNMCCFVFEVFSTDSSLLIGCLFETRNLCDFAAFCGTGAAECARYGPSDNLIATC